MFRLRRRRATLDLDEVDAARESALKGAHLLCDLGRIDYSIVVSDDGSGRKVGLVYLRRPQNMHHALSLGEEVVGDDAPMAAPPEGLGAHDCASMPGAAVQQPRQASCERLGQGVIGVVLEPPHPPITVD